MDIGHLIQLLLEVVITVLLPFALRALIQWINSQIREINARKDQVVLRTVVDLVRQLVNAAEMNGLSGAIQNIGKEKKRYVFDLAEAELKRRGITLDLDVLDALIEAQVKTEIRDVDVLFPPTPQAE